MLLAIKWNFSEVNCIGQEALHAMAVKFPPPLTVPFLPPSLPPFFILETPFVFFIFLLPQVFLLYPMSSCPEPQSIRAD